MISIGIQFDYELNSKNHSKKNKNVLDFFDFFRFLLDFFFDLFLIFWIFLDFFFFLDCFFDFFSICFWIFFDFNWISIGFFLKFDFFDFFDFFGFFSISIGFQLDFFGFQLDFNWISIGFFHERWRSDKPEKKKTKKSKKIKNQIQNSFLFFDFNWFNSKI